MQIGCLTCLTVKIVTPHTRLTCNLSAGADDDMSLYVFITVANQVNYKTNQLVADIAGLCFFIVFIVVVVCVLLV